MAKPWTPDTLAASPQPAPEDREALVEGIAQIIDHPSVYMGGPSRNSLRIAEAIVKEYADTLLARGLRLPAPETMAWGILRKDGEIIAGGLRNKEAASNFAHEGERIVRVAIRVVEGGDE